MSFTVKSAKRNGVYRIPNPHWARVSCGPSLLFLRGGLHPAAQRIYAGMIMTANECRSSIITQNLKYSSLTDSLHANKDCV